jgi:hypothetical protein
MAGFRHDSLPGLYLGSLAGNEMTRYDPRLFPRTGGHKLPHRAVSAYRGTLRAYLVFALAYVAILTMVIVL